jgi:transposase
MQIYGIDLSKEKFDVSYLDSSGKEKFKVVDNELNCISKFISTLPKDSWLCAEHTGCYGDLLVFMCNQVGIPISLIPGYTLKHSFGIVKGKSDPIDARRIKEYGDRNFDKLFKTSYHSNEIAELRELRALRSQLVKSKKLLKTSAKERQQLPFQSLSVKKYADEAIEAVEASIKQVEKEIESIILGSEELAKIYYLVTSIIGVGPVITTELIIKTGNFKIIETAKKAASYTGVCPFPDRSGKMVKKSKTSNLADKHLKTLLFMGAKAAAKHNPDFRLYFQRKALEGKHYYLIMNNISNKLLRTIYSVVINQTPYEKNYITRDPRKMFN